MKLKYETPEITVVEIISSDVFMKLSGGGENDFEDTDW